MKSLATAMAFIVSFSLAAQHKNVSTEQRINDNGKILSIKIKGTADGKPVDYNQTFSVVGMSEAQKDALKKRVYDSLGLPVPVPPVAPIPPVAAEMTLVAPATPAVPAIPATPGVPVVISKSQYSETYAFGGDHPYTKEITYNPKTGMLRMKYRFNKDGEEKTMEKIIDAKDKSKEEKDEIIKKYEREIGVLEPEVI